MEEANLASVSLYNYVMISLNTLRASGLLILNVLVVTPWAIKGVGSSLMALTYSIPFNSAFLPSSIAFANT